MDTEHTQGSLTKEAIRLAWPAVCESFFIALAGMVDTFMVSTLGANAVAAVGLTTQPKFLGLALFIAANVAISALVARRFGEKRQQAANEILVMTICFCIVSAVIISALTVGFADQIIEFCGSSEDTHAMAARYYRIIMGGMIFNVLSMGINAARRRGQYDDRP
ncbi:MAG: MATE family efflux transporter [Waltera sp.]